MKKPVVATGFFISTYNLDFKYIDGINGVRSLLGRKTMNIRLVSAILFVLAIMTLGIWLVTIGTEGNIQLLKRIGTSIFIAPVFLVLGNIVGFTGSKTPRYSGQEYKRFRVLYTTWIFSLTVPIGTLLYSSTLYPNAILEAITFFTSIWITYWGCRWIVQGFRRQKESVDEHGLGTR